MSDFKTELENLINKYSMEKYSDTPDFVLAKYLMDCVDVWNANVIARDRFYGGKRVKAVQGKPPTTDTALLEGEK